MPKKQHNEDEAEVAAYIAEHGRKAAQAHYGLSRGQVAGIDYRWKRDHAADVADAEVMEVPRKPMPPHRPRAPRRMMRVGVFDIECQSFDAVGQDGMFTCGCILPLDSDDIFTARLEFKDKGDDRRAIVEFIGELWKYDLLVGQNIIAFDGNWLNTRRMYHGMPEMRGWYLFDTYQAARSLALATGGKSLGNLIDVFGLDGEKTTIRKTTWSQARNHYDKETFERAMSLIVYHCEQDVIAQRDLFDELMPMTLTLNNSQIKVSKWRGGIPSWNMWLAAWKEAQKATRRETAAR